MLTPSVPNRYRPARAQASPDLLNNHGTQVKGEEDGEGAQVDALGAFGGEQAHPPQPAIQETGGPAHALPPLARAMSNLLHIGAGSAGSGAFMEEIDSAALCQEGHLLSGYPV